MSAGGMMSSNQRPIPLRRRPDLVVAGIDYLGVGYQVIKDPIALKYHRLQIEQYRILEENAVWRMSETSCGWNFRRCRSP